MNKVSSVPTKLTTLKNKNDRYYVETIFQQIQYPNKVIFFTWGAHNFCIAQSDDKHKNPCLRFKVNGLKFKGYVHIFYDWLDYYRIEFVSTHNNLKYSRNEVYFDELQTIIDEFVEKQDNYAY